MSASAPPGAEDANELYEQAPCGYVSTDPRGRILRVNETFERWCERPRQELVGSYFVDLLTVPGRIYHDTHFGPLLAMQGHVREIALDLKRPNKPALPTIANATIRRNEEGEIVRHLITLFDSTQRRSYERELLEARRRAERAVTSRDALLSMLSHDIRSPLGSILMAVRLARAVAAEPLQRHLNRIERAGNQALDLVNAILTHSKLESGTATWSRAPVDLFALIDELTAVFEVMAETKSLKLVRTVDPRLPRLLAGDRLKLGQILSNLVGNALKFTSEGSVEIAVRYGGEGSGTVRVEFSVQDTGVGIEESVQRAIFEDYQQGSEDVSARYGGTGLGLAIAKRLVELAGGELRVASQPGEGATFSFGLDMSPVEDQRAAYG